MHEQRDRLRHVERRAATEAHDAVGAVLAIGLDSGEHLALHWIPEDTGEDRGFDPGSGEPCFGGAHLGARREPSIGDDERSRATGFGERLRKQAHRSGSELNPRGEVELMDGHHTGPFVLHVR